MGWLTNAAKVAAILFLVAAVIAGLTALVYTPTAVMSSAMTSFRSFDYTGGGAPAPTPYRYTMDAFRGTLHFAQTASGGLNYLDGIIPALLLAVLFAALAYLAVRIMQASAS